MIKAQALPKAKKPPRLRRQLRWTELQLLLLPIALVLIGMIIVISVPHQQVGWSARDLWMTFVFIGLVIGSNLALTIWLPRSDQLILPLISSLTAFGLIMTQRLETSLTGNIASRQVLWIGLGYVVFLAVTLGIKNFMWLKRYKYTLMAIGIGLDVVVLLFGRTINGARLWFSFGPFSFQPSELLKIILVVFMAAYLDDKRDLMENSRLRLGPINLPPLPYLAPLLIMWGFSMLIVIFQRELGAAELFFGIVLIILYVASGKASYVLGGIGLFAVGAFVAVNSLPYVQTRITDWINPWPVGKDQGYQIVQALFAFANGGVFGSGLEYGAPYFIPEVHTDYVFAAIGEELGLAGTLGIIALFLLLIYRSFHIALNTRNSFYQLMAIGLAAIYGLQTFIIIGGVTKLIPLSGMTLPFISYGGSSIIINFAIAGILMRISAED